MNILFFSDNYADDVCGTKVSIFESLKKLGHEVFWYYKTETNRILKLCRRLQPDQIWLVHSGLKIRKSVRDKINIPIVGFGFSDPYGFGAGRLDSYNVYVTNHLETYDKYNKQLPCIYNPTACYLKFHKKMDIEKDIDCSIIGCGKHIRFPDQSIRIKLIDRLRKETNFRICAFGPGWPEHPDNFPKVSGEKFLRVINRTKIGLDLQEDFAPLAHRVFEYGACGVPCITRRRPEAEKILKEYEQALFYSSFEDLKQQVVHYLENPDLLESLSKNVFHEVRNNHDISNRMSHIMSELKRILKW